ncbi:MAG: hypothetical protein GF317_14420 [Candidatus Lokiarchaeota archaeon]|nr:hypothetical protein [Candidatus Lokiarchaeota archaeon]MBD3200801.1 hypothetical protein [Candidatus Lokiarchaeota archaeon]
MVLLLFISLVVGLIFLFLAELIAPYNSHFYLNPILYMIFFALLACTLFAEYMIAVEVFFNHIRVLFIVGILSFIGIEFLYIISVISYFIIHFQTYPLIVYISFESSYYLGIAACIMFIVGCFKMGFSNRLEDKSRRNMIIIGILWGVNAFYHTWLAWGIFFVNFAVQFNLYLSILMLGWIAGETLTYILIIYNFIKYLH